jgi:hypothetical protein
MVSLWVLVDAALVVWSGPLEIAVVGLVLAFAALGASLFLLARRRQWRMSQVIGVAIMAGCVSAQLIFGELFAASMSGF